MAMKLTRDDVLHEIDAVLDLDDEELVSDGCEKLLNHLLLENASLDPDERAFLIGYITYIRPGVKSENSRHVAQTQLLQAHATASSSSISARSALYLGHLFYDVGELSEAQHWFSQARLGELTDYLRLKAEEMVVCCAIRMHGLRASLPALGELVSLAEAMSMEDVWPQELARVLETKRAELQEDGERQLFRKLAIRLDAAGSFGRWFREIAESRE